MKKTLLLFLILLSAHATWSQVTIVPSTFSVDQSITITVDINSTATNCNGLNNPTEVYMHSGIGDDSNPWGFSVVGNWGQDNGVGEMTNNGDGTWSITLVPETYYSLNASQASSATKIGMVFRNGDGSQELKDNGCSDFFFNVGSFQVSLSSPEENSTTILSSGGSLSISATNTNGTANYNLKANGSSLNTQNNTSSFSFTHTNITSNQNYELEVTQNGETLTKSFSVLINPGTISQTLPTNMVNGINYDETDATKATLVLDAPFKDFVYVAGSFNNYEPTSAYAMKKDSSNGMFWLELTGLTPGEVYTYQYWVADQTPISNSPVLVKTADPFSTLVLSPFDDPYISASAYPNLPTYPNGQEREVTVLQTNQTPYNWQVTDFVKPDKEDLVVYELLIRDFDENRNFQDLIDRIDYFKNLNINAIELMPIMEFEGNESWGYNTAFHMALDKFYGTENKLKEFIDLCHQNGIAVILDIALNHAFGRNPMVRMWMSDPDNDGWGDPSLENPYFNQFARHSYNVGSDFNHQQERTQYYVERVLQHWIEEFKVDGFRWDLTKGFTQNCTASNESCTNSYQQDRVDILKQYADYQWSLDTDSYIIFEHLGTDTEEQQWANYRLNEDKGIMMWGKMTDPYNQLTMGYSSGSNINHMGHESHGFTEKRLIGYAESHDEERLMYKNIQYGNSSGGYDVQDLNTALSRMSALGAVSLTIPGPKMIWHFGDLGMDNSIFTCTDGTVNDQNGSNGDCKLSTKPQPQWTENWLTNTNRNQIYNDWSRMIALKTNRDVFKGDYTIVSGTLTPKIYVFDDTLPSSELKNVVIISNFDVTTQNINPNFPYTGTWYDLMDDTGATSINVSSTTATISLAPGEFKIYGNQSVQSLSIKDISETNIILYPNPTSDGFYINTDVSSVKVYDITGKMIKKFNEKPYSINHLFQLGNYEPGMYIIQIQGLDGKQHTTKLVKL
ncbi:alpha-amylase family glycosyl hydrolase [Mangrovimonas aestuarii]|uniref:alpha-amylase family glycosyl hydrolase n=1 Tax=Mangrovimonas aestuarii TaxID=3018443 RepID=UPI002378B13C|nr:alpha-amylase family glycosyl hydrolase [Mangrovimonas aestuarii]